MTKRKKIALRLEVERHVMEKTDWYAEGKYLDMPWWMKSRIRWWNAFRRKKMMLFVRECVKNLGLPVRAYTEVSKLSVGEVRRRIKHIMSE